MRHKFIYLLIKKKILVVNFFFHFFKAPMDFFEIWSCFKYSLQFDIFLAKKIIRCDFLTDEVYFFYDLIAKIVCIMGRWKEKLVGGGGGRNMGGAIISSFIFY